MCGPDGRDRAWLEDREDVAAFLAVQECAEGERQAVEIVREYLESWREAHPDVAAYVEEWLDLVSARRLTELMLENNVRDLRSVAEVLAGRGELSGTEVEGMVKIP